jgi:hypothetical protein
VATCAAYGDSTLLPDNLGRHALIQSGEEFAGGAAGPGLVLATGGDVVAHAGRDTMRRIAAGQMTLLPPGEEVPF